MRRHFDWAGMAAFALALGISLALAGSLIVIAWNPKPLDSQLEALLSAIVGAAVGAVGTYLGTTAHRNFYQSGGGRKMTTTEQPPGEPQPAIEPEHPDITPDQYEDTERDPDEPDYTEPEEAGKNDGPTEGVAP